jgi:hypothetical protein
MDGKRKFFTCNSEEEILKRFQAIQPTKEKMAETEKSNGRPKNGGENQPIEKNRIPETASPDESMRLANYMELAAKV